MTQNSNVYCKSPNLGRKQIALGVSTLFSKGCSEQKLGCTKQLTEKCLAVLQAPFFARHDPAAVSSLFPSGLVFS